MQRNALDNLLWDIMKSGLTPCATLAVSKNSRLVYSYAEGHSRLGGQDAVPIDGQTQFNIGSVTKPITASLIVKLAEMGLLTLEDPVKRHIPEYKFDNVTILHLMTHTAGYDSSIDREPHWNITAAGIGKYMNEIYSIDTLLYEPGSVSAYCTQYYSILMDIIERISGKSLEEFASARLFEPLGMDRTTFDTSRLKEGEFALPWKKANESKYDYTRHNPPTGDSGLYSTATDLLKFANLFLNEGLHNGKQIFCRSAINLMLTEITCGRFMKTPAFWVKGSGPCRSAFGDMNSCSAVCHAGFSGTLLLIDPNYDIAFVFISNSNDLHDDYSNFRKICNAVMASFI